MIPSGFRAPGAALLLTLLASPAGIAAAADTKVGEAMPDIAFGPLLHGDGRTRLVEFRGQPVVVIEWVASSPNCWRYAIPKARDLDKKYADSGLVVILTESELEDQVDLQAELMKEAPGLSVRCAGVCALPVAWTEEELLPRFAVVDADGKLAGEGLIHTRAKLLDDLARDLAKACAKADPPAMEVRVARATRQVDYLLEQGEPSAARACAERLAKDLSGDAEGGPQVAELLARFDDPAVRADLDLETKVERVVKPLQSKRPKGPEAKKLRALVEDSPDSRVAQRALRLAAAIERATSRD